MSKITSKSSKKTFQQIRWRIRKVPLLPLFQVTTWLRTAGLQRTVCMFSGRIYLLKEKEEEKRFATLTFFCKYSFPMCLVFKHMLSISTLEYQHKQFYSIAPSHKLFLVSEEKEKAFLREHCILKGSSRSHSLYLFINKLFTVLLLNNKVFTVTVLYYLI